MPACGPDSTGGDAVLSRRRLRSVGTMETVVVRFGVGSWPEAESDPCYRLVVYVADLLRTC